MSWVPVSRSVVWRAIAGSVLGLVAGLVILCAAARAVAAGDATITVVPPAGAHVDSADPPPRYFRTADPRPTLGIEANAGSLVRCALDSASSWGPCGPPLPGCTATVCASYRPPTPLKGVGGEAGHSLGVELFDSAGNRLATAYQSFTVDRTPPAVRIGLSPGSDPLRPSFDVSVTDDEFGDPRLATDVADCSLTPVGARPVWRACIKPGIGQGTFGAKLPHRHIDYQAQVRGTDDLGRTAFAHLDFDPVPCSLVVRPPANLGHVTASGFPVQARCSYTQVAHMLIYPVAVNGRQYASSPAAAVADRPLIGSLTVRAHRQHWDFRRSVHLFASAAAQTTRFKSVRFLVLVCPREDCEFLDPGWDYTEFTVRR